MQTDAAKHKNEKIDDSDDEVNVDCCNNDGIALI
jgi:hypothetical protein